MMIQEYTSAKTCVKQVPALHKKIEWTFGDMFSFNLDYGGGKYDDATEFLWNEFGVRNLVYDPFNRSQEHNQMVLSFITDILRTGVDTCTLSNVLCVIKEKEVRRQVLEHIKSLVKKGGFVYISVYRGIGDTPRKTCNGWQNNKPLKWYLPEIREVFPKAYIYNGYIVAQNRETGEDSRNKAS